MSTQPDSANAPAGHTISVAEVIERSRKVIAVHLNYRSRAAQRGRFPSHPSFFLKPATSLALSERPVERPAGTTLLTFEGEIALVIGRRTRRVSPQHAWECVQFVCAANDLGVYDLRAVDKGSNLRSKGGDGFTPIGPQLLRAREIDPARLRVRTWVNGRLAQDGDTSDLLFPFTQLIADLSQLITLEAGDVILTGTPAGSSVVTPGDTVEVQVDSVEDPRLNTGRLRTPVVAGTDAFADFGAQPHADEAQIVDAWGSRAAVGLEPEFVLTESLKAKLASVGTATLSAQLRKRGLNAVTIDGLTPTHPDKRMVGRARTLRFVPLREDLFKARGGGYNAQKRAFDSLEPGDVLVIEGRGEKGSGTVGDILALRAQVRGAVGIVTDGGVRDVAAVSALDICTFHGGPHPAVLGRRHVPWDVDIAVACGGATVEPGDVLVGDADGVVVIPPGLAEDIADSAIAQEAEEQYIADRVAEGAALEGLYPMNDSARTDYEQSRRGRQADTTPKGSTP